MALATGISTTPTPSPAPLVLLVDDQELSLRVLRDVIESAGYHCVTARSATDALIYCDRRRPQAVVTDLDMPGLDGSMLARWLKARYPTLPLLLVTGQDLEAVDLDDLRTHFAEILTKPLDPRRLLDALHASLPAPR
jgi:CheY-like chemotaxis protein